MTKARNLSDLLDATGDVVSSALDNVPPSNDASALTTGTLPDARLSNQVKVVKSGSAPSSPQEGDLWYDSNNELLKIYVASASSFAKVSPQIPTIASISGDITVETASNLTITGENFIDGSATVTFTRGGTSSDVSVTPTSESEITVAVPSAIYTGASVGDSVSITVTNADVRTTPESTKTVVGRPVTLSSISGNIYNGTASTLTLTGVGFNATPLTVKFTGSNDTTATVASDTSATVVVPSAVYNNPQTYTITVTNADNITSSGINKTAINLPSGGTITNSGGYRIHTFTSSGTFVNTISNLSVEYLVIAGGGAGGGGYGGGGGAGGYRNSVSGETSGANSSAESALSLSTGNKTVTVGAGATSTSAGYGQGAVNGNNSVFDTITATAGGGGANTGVGNSGGSGGGGMDNSAGGAGTSGQGFQGGGSQSAPNYGAGGGGGASAQGADGTSAVGGNGGNGLASSITGSSVIRAGGGGGGTYNGGTSGSGGSGGGGNAGSSSSYPDNGDAGSVNTGSGGGGATAHPYSTRGGNGGSGIVIVRYQI